MHNTHLFRWLREGEIISPFLFLLFPGGRRGIPSLTMENQMNLLFFFCVYTWFLFFLYEKNWISLSLACSWNFFLFSFRFPFCFLVGRSKLMKFKDDGCWLMRYSFIWWMSLIFQNKVDEIVLLFLFVSTVRTVIECYLKDLDGIENRN